MTMRCEENEGITDRQCPPPTKSRGPLKETALPCWRAEIIRSSVQEPAAAKKIELAL